MNKWFLLAAVLMLLANLVGPAVVSAQPDVMGFYGSVVLDGESVPDGTTVEALIDGEGVASTTTTSSKYVLKIDCAGKDYVGRTVTFTVGADWPVMQTAVYEKGANIWLDLIASSTDAPASPSRILPEYVARGGTIEVGVTFTAPSDDFNAIGLTDFVPFGWDVEVHAVWCTPNANFLNVVGNRAEIMWFGPYPAGTAFTAVYHVDVPEDVMPGTYTFSNGSLEYRIAGTGTYSEGIGGDPAIQVIEGTPIAGSTGEVDCAPLGNVAITLFKDGVEVGSTVSDAAGNYGITVAEPGEYQVKASKYGFRDETQSVSIAGIGPAYSATLDFVAEHGLVPNAPSMSYALTCVNHWLYPYDGCGLSMSKVLGVVNAWQYPAPQVERLITIGNLTDKTGPAASSLIPVDMALTDAVNYFNEQNLIPGAHIEVSTYDTAYDPARVKPGYEWLRDKGADMIVSGVPMVATLTKPWVDEDKMVFFPLTASPDTYTPPGYTFSLNIPTEAYLCTLMKWIPENDPDFPKDRPAKIGILALEDPYAQTLLDGVEEYCMAHPDQWQYADGFVVPWTQVTFPTEVEALKGCDYVMPPSTGGFLASFVKEMRDAGSTATFLGTDAQAAYLGLMLDVAGWDHINGMLFALPYTWWNEDAPVANLCNQVLAQYHSAGEVAELKWAGGSYRGAFTQWYGMLTLLGEAINEVGPEAFDSQALYDQAIEFSHTFDGNGWDYSLTDRTSWTGLGIHISDAVVEELVRVSPAWVPVVWTPPGPTPVTGPAWVHDVAYQDEQTVWTTEVIGEEIVDGVPCYVATTSFDKYPFRYAPNGTPIKVFDLTDWVSKATLDTKKTISDEEALGMIDLTLTQTRTYSQVDHGQPFAAGDSYTYDLFVHIDPPTLAPDYTDTVRVEVVAVEDVTVPAGTFRCYRVAFTRTGSSDAAKVNPQLLRTEWWAGEYDLLAPVKVVEVAQWDVPETRELASYTPMPAKTHPAPDLWVKESTDLVGTSWVYEVTYDNDDNVATNTTDWTATVTSEGADSFVATTGIEGTPKVNFFFPPMGMSFGVDVASQTLTRDKVNLSAVKEDFAMSVTSVNMTIDATRAFSYAGDHGAPFTVGKEWSYTAPVDAPEQGIHLGYSFDAEVVGIEQVTVPAGTYNCYKVVHTSGDKTNIEWWVVDGGLLTPVKYVDGTTFVGTLTFELASYNAP